ncbi:MAG: DUF2087 domain-containing protein [Acholeplasmataceae bacterium]|nr:DUF2087 domain-containing protein [Acholeplasmataceae bacterium]
MFNVSAEDIKLVKEKYVTSMNPFIISNFPPKEKRKYILLCMIVHLFEDKRRYTEKEVNEILKYVYQDYAIIRRYLVEYRFIDRLADGSAYWLMIDKNDYIQYI